MKTGEKHQDISFKTFKAPVVAYPRLIKFVYLALECTRELDGDCTIERDQSKDQTL